jgi:hypothetical protein
VQSGESSDQRILATSSRRCNVRMAVRKNGPPRMGHMIDARPDLRQFDVGQHAIALGGAQRWEGPAAEMEPSPAMGTVPVSVRPVVRGLSAKSGLSASIKVNKFK